MSDRNLTDRRFHDDKTEDIDDDVSVSPEPEAVPTADEEIEGETEDEPEEGWDQMQPPAAARDPGVSPAGDVADQDDSDETDDDVSSVVRFRPDKRGGAREVRVPSRPEESRASSVIREQMRAKRLAEAEADEEGDHRDTYARFIERSGGYWVVRRTGPVGMPSSELGELGYRIPNSRLVSGKTIEDAIRERSGGGSFLCSPRLSNNEIVHAVPDYETTISGDPIPSTDEGRVWLERRRERAVGSRSTESMRTDLAAMFEAQQRSTSEMLRQIAEQAANARREQSSLVENMMKAMADGREADRQRIAVELEEKRLTAQKDEAERRRQHDVDMENLKQQRLQTERELARKIEEERQERLEKQRAEDRRLEMEREERRRKDDAEREERQRRDELDREERRQRAEQDRADRMAQLEADRIKAENETRLNLERMRLTYLSDAKKRRPGAVDKVIDRAKAEIVSAHMASEVSRVKRDLGLPEQEDRSPNWLDKLLEMATPILPAVAGKLMGVNIPVSQPTPATESADDGDDEDDEAPDLNLGFGGTTPPSPAPSPPSVTIQTPVEVAPAQPAAASPEDAIASRFAQQRARLEAGHIRRFVYGLAVLATLRPSDAWGTEFDEERGYDLWSCYGRLPDWARSALENEEGRHVFFDRAKSVAPEEVIALRSALQEEPSRVWLAHCLKSNPVFEDDEDDGPNEATDNGEDQTTEPKP